MEEDQKDQNLLDDLRSRYFEKLNIDPQKEKTKIEAALERSYQQRTFEIEHLWKRATFFWGLQAGVFAAFGLVWKAAEEVTGSFYVLFMLAGMGFLTALSNSFAARGSKFWQQNWEDHIDMLESHSEGELYRTVWLREGQVSFSVSGVSERLNDCFAVFWLGVLSFVTWNIVNPTSLLFVVDDRLFQFAFLLFGSFAIIAGVLWIWKKTSFDGERIFEGMKDATWRSDQGRGHGHRLLRKSSFALRYDPIERGKTAEELKESSAGRSLR